MIQIHPAPSTLLKIANQTSYEVMIAVQQVYTVMAKKEIPSDDGQRRYVYKMPITPPYANTIYGK